jgi:hypothetical protein
MTAANSDYRPLGRGIGAALSAFETADNGRAREIPATSQQSSADWDWIPKGGPRSQTTQRFVDVHYCVPHRYHDLLMPLARRAVSAPAGSAVANRPARVVFFRFVSAHSLVAIYNPDTLKRGRD